MQLRLLLILISGLSLTGCADEVIIAKLPVDDRIDVNLTITDPAGDQELLVLNIADTSPPRVASRLIPRGFSRESGVSVLAYLAFENTNLAGPTCTVLEGNLNPFQRIRGFRPGDFYMEFISSTEDSNDCLPLPFTVEATIRQGTYEVGDEPDQVTLYVWAMLNGGENEVPLKLIEAAEFRVMEIDYTSGEALGVPGLYFTFEVVDAVFRDLEGDEDYSAPLISGRLFSEYYR